jgi:hypothetical protein
LSIKKLRETVAQQKEESEPKAVEALYQCAFSYTSMASDSDYVKMGDLYDPSELLEKLVSSLLEIKEKGTCDESKARASLKKFLEDFHKCVQPGWADKHGINIRTFSLCKSKDLRRLLDEATEYVNHLGEADDRLKAQCLVTVRFLRAGFNCEYNLVGARRSIADSRLSMKGDRCGQHAPVL